jgi:lysosomal alpha-mannosidase
MKNSSTLQWPIYRGDFFPYNGVHIGSYWSGYYTSRPNFKKFIRDYTGVSQSLENLIGFETMVNRTLNGNSKDVIGFNRNKINSWVQKVGELTHHDTITGTSLRSVVISETNDIERNLTSAKTQISEIIKKKVYRDIGIDLKGISICHHDMNDEKVCPDPYFNLRA